MKNLNSEAFAVIMGSKEKVFRAGSKMQLVGISLYLLELLGIYFSLLGTPPCSRCRAFLCINCRPTCANNIALPKDFHPISTFHPLRCALSKISRSHLLMCSGTTTLGWSTMESAVSRCSIPSKIATLSDLANNPPPISFAGEGVQCERLHGAIDADGVDGEHQVLRQLHLPAQHGRQHHHNTN